MGNFLGWTVFVPPLGAQSQQNVNNSEEFILVA